MYPFSVVFCSVYYVLCFLSISYSSKKEMQSVKFHCNDFLFKIGTGGMNDEEKYNRSQLKSGRKEDNVWQSG